LPGAVAARNRHCAAARSLVDRALRGKFSTNSIEQPFREFGFRSRLALSLAQNRNRTLRVGQCVARSAKVQFRLRDVPEA
jgi:hypothetical protein